MACLKCFACRPALVLLLLLLLAGAACRAGEADPPALQLEGLTVQSPRLAVVFEPSGWPAQLAIKPAPAELPLHARAAKGPPADELLAAIGRGPRLRNPMRLEARANGAVLKEEVAAPAQPVLQDGAVAAASALKLGPVNVKLATRFGADGALRAELEFDTGGQSVEALELIMDLRQPLHTLVVGPPTGEQVQILPAQAFSIPPREGALWGNAEQDAKAAGRPAPGVPEHLFVGGGDFGFTLLTTAAGWQVDPTASCMTLERDAKLEPTLRLRLINRPAKLDRPAKVGLTWLVHPATFPAPRRRRTAWLEWPHAQAAAAPFAAADRAKTLAQKPALARADAASLLEAAAPAVLLEGPAGGAGVSAEQDLAATVPAELFQYLAATHTGLTARLAPNARALTQPGRNPAPDRMALGRALLHDIGLDAGGLANPADAARVMGALEAFGFFDAEDLERVPYWRSSALVRYGPLFEKEQDLAVTETDPYAQVYVTLYRKPRLENQKPAGVDVLLVVVNESDKPVRERLYFADAKAVFGGPNRQLDSALRGAYDYSRLPPGADWARAHGNAKAKGSPCLKDLEDGGVVDQMKSKGGSGEIYGPLHVPARGMRLLYAFGTGR
ncbi:MAG: hypothetical protein M5U26_04765 [Planctomycetota bacterium]|nr:hypothetical protein [Planctomycetota bacterium]